MGSEVPSLHTGLEGRLGVVAESSSIVGTIIRPLINLTRYLLKLHTIDTVPMTLPEEQNQPRPNWLAFGLIVLFVLVVVGLIGYLAFGLGKESETTKKDDKPAANNQTTKQGTSEIVTIRITKNGFDPAEAKIKKGVTVVWVNDDTKAHQPASNPHPVHDQFKDLGSGEVLIKKGDEFSLVFNKTGTFRYHDHLNPLNFNGTIKVE